MDSAELAEWMAYELLEPWGGRVDDLRTGIIASTYANCQRTSKTSTPYNAKDFTIDYGKRYRDEPEEEEELTPAQQVHKALALMGARKGG